MPWHPAVIVVIEQEHKRKPTLRWFIYFDGTGFKSEDRFL